MTYIGSIQQRLLIGVSTLLPDTEHSYSLELRAEIIKTKALAVAHLNSSCQIDKHGLIVSDRNCSPRIIIAHRCLLEHTASSSNMIKPIIVDIYTYSCR